MLNDQLSLFEKLIWSAYIIVWVWMWAYLLGNNEHLWKLHGIYSRNPIPKNDEKKIFQWSVWSQESPKFPRQVIMLEWEKGETCI